MNEKRKINPIRSFLYLFPICYKAAPMIVNACIMIWILNGITGGLMIFFNQRLFDAAADFTQNLQPVSAVVHALIIFGLWIILDEAIIDSINWYLPEIWVEIVKGKLGFLLSQKIDRLNPECFEDKTF